MVASHAGFGSLRTKVRGGCIAAAPERSCFRRAFPETGQVAVLHVAARNGLTFGCGEVRVVGRVVAQDGAEFVAAAGPDAGACRRSVDLQPGFVRRFGPFGAVGGGVTAVSVGRSLRFQPRFPVFQPEGDG